ncbi:MAG: ribosome-associated translation inhibitor RaiA [Armatimonadetes bacterium]|nr:ribosome-associated translation inhibitor RaiA [Armatimonadota bacterium]
MQVQVRGKGVVITDALRDYADKKVNKLSKHFATLQTATVTQSVHGKHHRVEVQLEGDGILLRGEYGCEDMYAAIDHVVDKLERRMSKYKERHKWHQRGNHHEHDSPRHMPTAADDEADDDDGKVLRRKRFAIKPLTELEAVAQMELLSHDFFVFENADTGQVSVLYRRADKNYGILEPER